jgi:hypothetical protein
MAYLSIRFPPSFVPDRLYWIDPHRPSRRQERRGGGDRHQDRGHGRKGDRIRGPHAEELIRQKRRERGSAENAEGDAKGRQRHVASIESRSSVVAVGAVRSKSARSSSPNRRLKLRG